jgi:hypothetical protein
MGMFNNVRNQARKSIELLYEHTCNTFEYQKVKDSITKVTNSKEVPVLIDQPCKISFSTIKSAIQTESANELSQVIKLFISPDVTIKPGSKVSVTHNGRTDIYKNSGVPAVYSSHQEIVLELFKGWS